MDIVKELEKFCDYAIEMGYLEETDKSPLINIYMAHFYNSMSECERQPVTNNKGNGSKCDCKEHHMFTFVGDKTYCGNCGKEC